MWSVKRDSSANCHTDVAADGVREASRARAPDSPSPGEGRVSRMRRTPLQDVVAGPLAQQVSGAQWAEQPGLGRTATKAP